MKSILNTKQKKAQSMFVGLMIAFAWLVVVLAMTPILKSILSSMMDADHIGCYNMDSSFNQSNDIFIQATCMVVKTTFFYFIAVAIAIGVMTMYWRKTF